MLNTQSGTSYLTHIADHLIDTQTLAVIIFYLSYDTIGELAVRGRAVHRLAKDVGGHQQSGEETLKCFDKCK